MYLSKITLCDDPIHSRSFWTAFRSPYRLHQAIWKLFGDNADRERDFLYHVKEIHAPPIVYALSARSPTDPDGLWQCQTKQFEPKLKLGMHLGFFLRANPVRTREGKRHDVVMEEKHRLKIRGIPRRDWPTEAELVQMAGARWLADRSGKAGFQVHSVRVDGYRQQEFFKSGSTRPVRISTLDFTGVLEVLDPSLFSDAICRGFGPAKGFGCGLMLIRRT